MWRRTVAISVVVLSVVAETQAQAAAATTTNRLLSVCREGQYAFTPKLREAFLCFAREKALAELAARGKGVPADLLAWVEADREVEASVYGAHHRPWDVLLWLHALRMELGRETFERYHQLALAAAIVSAKLEEEPDVTPRGPVKLAIGGDPRKPVDTQDSGRALDVNDHIINFLNAHTIEEEVVVGHTNVLPELKYDERGIAIPVPKRTRPKKVAVTETRTRALYAADVLASTNLQHTFNAYMKAKGHDIAIDCGERVIHWKSRDMVRGERNNQITTAYQMFRKAYEAKGLLPEKRDPYPTPGERCAYLIRNHEHDFSPELREKRKWPRFPLTAPWPVLTMLVVNNQPLREREERWVAFRDKGEFKTYGEYIGGIAQQFAMQSARRLKPHPFTYGTIQMMLKDGGVCGTMGAISSRSHCILGIPASQASQPGHCAMVAYRYDAKSGTYSCKGGQYATGGDDKTTPFVPWFGEDQVKRIRRKAGHEVSYHQRKPMVYHQTVAWAVNYGMKSYLDSWLTHAVFRALPENERGTKGVKLLESGLALNPYNFLLIDAAQAVLDGPRGQMDFWKTFQSALASREEKPGCPVDGLYPKTVKNKMFARIAKLPVPEDKQVAGEVLAFLEQEDCAIPEALVSYRLALDGLSALLLRTERDFTNHLVLVRGRASRENDTDCKAMADTLKAVSGRIKDGKQRKAWALGLWEKGRGDEKYFGHGYRVATHPAMPLLTRMAGRKLPTEGEMARPVLGRVSAELEVSVAGERNVKDCRILAAKIKAAANSLKDADIKREWFEALSKVIVGKETFIPANARKNAKPTRDPCADAIKQGLQT